MTATTPMHDACGCDKCSDARIGGHFTAGGPPPATGRPRDYFTREAVTGGMPTEPTPAPRDEAREDAYNRIMLAAGKLWAQPVSESNVMEFSEVVTEALAAAPRADPGEIWESAAKLVMEAVTSSHWTIQEPNHEWTAVNGVALYGAFRKLAAAARAPGRET